MSPTFCGLREKQLTVHPSTKLMYKMSYYRFADLFGGGKVSDRVRGVQLPAVGPTLDVIGQSSSVPPW